MRESFVFYRSFYESICELDKDEQYELFIAICEYSLYGEEPDLTGALKAMFLLIRPQIDKNNVRYENGKKGGAPKGNQNAKKTTENNRKQPNDNGTGSVQDSAADLSLFGEFNNVKLTPAERKSLSNQFERSGKLIDKVSRWIRKAKNTVPDHYALCIKFAERDNWPKRKEVEPVKPITVSDPLEPDEQERRVIEMRAKLNEAIPSG